MASKLFNQTLCDDNHYSLAGSHCPICLEIHELKCLPCLHYVCMYCLERTANGSTSVVRCPIDNRVFDMPEFGIDALPTKGVLVAVMENFPAAQGSLPAEICGALKSCKQDVADSMQELDSKLRVALEKERQIVKERIHKAAEAFRESITAKEMKLYQDMETLFGRERRRRQEEIVRISCRVLRIAQCVEDELMQNKEPVPMRKTKAQSLLLQVESIKRLNKELRQMDVQNTPGTKMLVSFTPEEPAVNLGRLDYSGSGDYASGGSLSNRPKLFRYSKSCKLIHTLELPVKLKENFCPWAVSVSPDGFIAIADRGNARVILFNQRGEFIRSIERPCWDGKTTKHEVYGVTFLSDNTIVIADYSPSHSGGSMQLFDISGKHLRYLTTLRRPAYITSGAQDRIAVVYYLGCDNTPIEIYSRDGSLSPWKPLGDDLIHPHKAVLRDNLVFVSDSDLRNNCGTVKVYDDEGHLVDKLGHEDLWKGSGTGHPIRLAADPAMNNLLAYHSLSKHVKVYSCSSRALVARVQVDSGIVDMAVTSDQELVVSCGRCSNSPNAVKIFSLHD